MNRCQSLAAIVMAGIGLFWTASVQCQANPKYSGVDIPWLVNGSMGYGHDFAAGYYNATYAHEVIDDCHKANFNMVRVWAFEGLQGLSISGNTITVNSTFLSNIKDFVHYAWYTYGMEVEVVAFNNSDISAAQIENSAFSASMSSAVATLDQTLANDGDVYQIDMMNEIDYLADKSGWSPVHSFIYNTCQDCHRVSSHWVTASDDNSSDYNTSSSTWYSDLGGVGCDYYEFHGYNTSGSIVSSDIDGKPLELGEFGPPGSSGVNSDENNYGAWINIINDFYSSVNANSNYFSIMTWSYENDGSGYGMTNDEFDWLENSSGQSPMWTLDWYGANGR